MLTLRPRLFGIDTSIDPSFWLLIFGLIWIFGFWVMLGLIVSTLAHEFGHVWMASRYGVKLKKLYMFGLGMAVRLESPTGDVTEDVMGKRGALISVAGPVVNAVIAGLLFAVFFFDIAFLGTAVTSVIAAIMLLNVLFAALNMLPVLPLDGGRILQNLLFTRWSYRTSTLIATIVGTVIGLVLTAVAIYYSSISSAVIMAMLVAYSWYEYKKLN